MDSPLLTFDDINQKLKAELHAASVQVREAIEPFLVTPYQQMRYWDYADKDGQNEILPCWVIADLDKIGISLGFAYSQYGFGHYGSPWGLVFVHDDSFGMDCGWYRSLEHAVLDSGYLEEMLEYCRAIVKEADDS